MTIENGNFIRSAEKGAGYGNGYYVVYNQGTMTIQGGNFQYPDSVMNLFPVVVNHNGRMTISGGTFSATDYVIENEENLDENSGLFITGGTFTCVNGSLINWGKATLSGGVFTGNQYGVETNSGQRDVLDPTNNESGHTVICDNARVEGDIRSVGSSSKTEIKGGTITKDVVVYPHDTAIIAISGGTFSKKFDEKFLAAGYTQGANNDGTYTALPGITLDKTTLALYDNETATLTATVAPELGESTVSWSSSDEAVATVDGGTVTPVAAGTTTITATAGEKTATCTVTVSTWVPATAVTLNKTTMDLYMSRSETLTATVTPENTTESLTWSSSDETIATVDNGVVTAVATGTATITATAGNAATECIVTVKDLVPATGVTLDKTTASVYAGCYITLHATITPDYTKDTVAWSSSNEEVAVVSPNGSVSARAAGTAIITATAGDHTATCTVTVKALPENTTPWPEADETYITTLTSGNYILTASVNGPIVIQPGAVVTLDLNGCRIWSDSLTPYWCSTSNSDTYGITNNGTLTILDSSEDGDGDLYHNLSTSRVALYNAENATLTIQSGTITSTMSLAIENHGTLTVSGGTIASRTWDKSTTSSTTAAVKLADSEIKPAISNYGIATLTGGTLNGDVKTWSTPTATGKTVISGDITINGDVVSGQVKGETWPAHPAVTEIQGGTINGELSTIYEGSDAEDAPEVNAEISISGGTFDTEFNKDYLENGYTQVKDENGNYTTVSAIPATGLTISEETITLTKDQQKKLFATVAPATSTDTVAWSSSNEDIATVDPDSGTVTAVASGTATITAKAGEKTATCIVNVVCRTDGKCTHYPDVDAAEWYHSAVDFVTEEKIMQGHDTGNFGPEESLTRAQMAQILYNSEAQWEDDEPALGSTVINFTDVKAGEWYEKAIKWASSNGIVEGDGDNTFRPDDPVTRQEMVAMLYRYVVTYLHELPLPADGDNQWKSFPDYEDVADWATTPFAWAVHYGIINGDDGKLNPTNTATRGQAAKIVMVALTCE